MLAKVVPPGMKHDAQIADVPVSLFLVPLTQNNAAIKALKVTMG